MGEFHLLYFMKFLQIVIYSFLFSPANAQTEDWDTYMAKFGNKPGSVLVDMALIQKAPDKRYPYLVITGPRAQNCDAKGMPGKDEIDVLEDILNATGNFITGVTAKVLTGTFTYDCERLNYYYVKDTIGIRNAIMRLYNRGYQNYSYAINMKYDPAWTTYRTFLYPDEAMLNWMDNTKIITKMIQQGDSLITQRDINFDFYFNADTGRNAFSDFAKAHGYKARLIDSKAINAPYEIIVSKYGYVKIDAIILMTEELKTEAKKHKGLYNGWEAKK